MKKISKMSFFLYKKSEEQYVSLGLIKWKLIQKIFKLKKEK